jgi:type II secretory pathway pseudopilin PulG
MRIDPIKARRRRDLSSAFTLVEAVVASALAGILVLASLSGFSHGFASVKLQREYSRATQILLEKTELVHLYNWDQLTGNDLTTYVPTNFTAPFYPDASNGGLSYTGTALITTIPLTETYSNEMRMFTVTVSWKSGKVVRSRSMSTYVSHYGFQNYLY